MELDMRKLIDLPGIADLEAEALMKPRMADLGAEADYPVIDEVCAKAFGLTVAQADAIERPDGWDNIENKSAPAQVSAFEAEGWDVTNNRRPLRMLSVIAPPLWLAVRGVAGRLPFVADTAEEDAEAAAMKALAKEAKTFRRDR
jgi:hypothetical protein